MKLFSRFTLPGLKALLIFINFSILPLLLTSIKKQLKNKS